MSEGSSVDREAYRLNNEDERLGEYLFVPTISWSWVAPIFVPGERTYSSVTSGSSLSIRLSSAFPIVEFLILRSSPFAGKAVGNICHHRRERSKDHLSHHRNEDCFAINTLRSVQFPVFGVTGDLFVTRKGVNAIRPLIRLLSSSHSFACRPNSATCRWILTLISVLETGI